MNHIINSNIYALKEIDSLSLSMDSPLFFNYPAMKLGGQEQIIFYAKLICADIKKNILNKSDKQGLHHWVITAPAYFNLPSAANLLARYVYEYLVVDRYHINIIELRLSEQQVAVSNEKEFMRYQQYSKHTLQERINERQRIDSLGDKSKYQHGLNTILKNAKVIVVNDMCVTGTQQKFMHDELLEMDVAELHWMYIFKLSDALALSHPELEYDINTSQVMEIKEFSHILNDKKTEHTARCISRLFAENYNEFCALITMLDSRARVLIQTLCLMERRYSNVMFADKMAYLNYVNSQSQYPVFQINENN